MQRKGGDGSLNPPALFGMMLRASGNGHWFATPLEARNTPVCTATRQIFEAESTLYGAPYGPKGPSLTVGAFCMSELGYEAFIHFREYPLC